MRVMVRVPVSISAPDQASTVPSGQGFVTSEPVLLEV